MATLRVRVRPSSGRSGILCRDGKELVVLLKSPPERGKANRELLSLIKKEFGCEARILSGGKSRRKVLQLECSEDSIISIMMEIPRC